jgi:hypothetical protein
MITSPVTAAAETITTGAAPAGSKNPRVKSEDPASVKADAIPPLMKGHNSREYPTNATPSQAASCASRITAACPASARSSRP